LQPEGRDPAHLWDMLDAVRHIQRYTAGLTLERYLKEDMVQSAVERQLEILGEAARRVSEPLKQVHPEIPWRQIIAQRNVLAHEYGEIVPTLVWKTVVTYIPALAASLEPLIPPLPPETRL
jgi:uncharacterized protein with HEPN domain